jgi:hypothetical protein
VTSWTQDHKTKAGDQTEISSIWLMLEICVWSPISVLWSCAPMTRLLNQRMETCLRCLAYCWSVPTLYTMSTNQILRPETGIHSQFYNLRNRCYFSTVLYCTYWRASNKFRNKSCKFFVSIKFNSKSFSSRQVNMCFIYLSREPPNTITGSEFRREIGSDIHLYNLN